MDAYNNGAGIGDNELSRLTKVPQSTVTRIANGTTKDAKEKQLKPLADFFGVSTGQLRGIDLPKGQTPAKAGGISKSAAPPDLSPEAIHLARSWLQLSPARRAAYLEEISWVVFFEQKFPYYRIGRPGGESYDKFERDRERLWESMMRQTKLPLE